VWPGWWGPTGYAEPGARAVAAVPRGATVAAYNRLASHLTSDRTVFPLDRGLRDATGELLDVDWVAAETTKGSFPITAPERRRLLDALQQCGYSPVHESGGFLVLRRIDPDARGTTLATCIDARTTG
jgi:hypothetical protein